jgi:hypothetical protein
VFVRILNRGVAWPAVAHFDDQALLAARCGGRAEIGAAWLLDKLNATNMGSDRKILPWNSRRAVD